MVALIMLCLYFYFIKLIGTCRLRVTFVKEDNDYNLEVIDTWLIWITWTSMSIVWKWFLKLTTHSLNQAFSTRIVFIS